MEIADRIGEIVKHYGLNSSSFSDRVGVQRSTLSHILSGRNKPSFDFVQKTLQHFPELNPNWLLTGKQNMLQTEGGPKLDLRFANTSKVKEEVPAPKTAPSPAKVTEQGDKQVKMVMVFYTDGTFEKFIS
jgi:transcriptional regulator with XRE-family HTH domain